MANRLWRGDAPAVAQVTKCVPADFEAGDKLRLHVPNSDGPYIEYEVQDGDDQEAVADGLVAAWEAATDPRFADATAATAQDADTEDFYVELTAATAGVPFTVVSSTSNSESGNVTVEETTPGVSPVNEVQKLELIGTYTGGTFTLTFDGQTTGAIAYNATDATVKAALEALSNIAVGDVAVTGGPGPASPWFVTFQGAYAATDVNLITVDGTNLTGGGSVTVETVTEGGGLSDEVQSFGFNGTGGTYTLSFGGQTTSALAHDATAATVQAALEALSSIGAGNVLVYGGQQLDQSSTTSFRFWLRFTGSLGQTNVSLIGIDRSNLAAPNWYGPIVETDSGGGLASVSEIQHINLGIPTGGTFTLTLDAKTTAAIAFDATIGDVEAALEALGNVAPGDIDVTGAPGQYVLIFRSTGAYADSDVSQVTVGGGNLIGGSGATAATIRPGGGQVDEVQHVRVFGSGGTFTLTFAGQTTGAIAYGAAAATVEAALEGLSNVVDVSVSGTGTAADPYVVTFLDPGDQDVAEMTGSGASLTGGGGQATTVTEAVAGVDEVQTVTVSSGVTGGTFTLSFQGVETAAIAYNASAATVEAALEALATIGGVTVAGAAGGPWTVTFDVAPLSDQDVELLVSNGSALVGGSGVETLTVSTLVASSGPEDWNVAANWTGNAVPVTGDDVFIQEATSSIRYGLDQSAVTLASFRQYQAYTGEIGLPTVNAAGYYEYRPTYLAFAGVTELLIGMGEGSGSGRTRIDLGAVESAVTVLNTGGPSEAALPALLLKGTHASNTLLVLEGSVGVAVLATESATLLKLTQRGGEVTLGSGTTIGADGIDKTGGELIADDATINGKFVQRG